MKMLSRFLHILHFLSDFFFDSTKHMSRDEIKKLGHPLCWVKAIFGASAIDSGMVNGYEQTRINH